MESRGSYKESRGSYKESTGSYRESTGSYKELLHDESREGDFVEIPINAESDGESDMG